MDEKAPICTNRSQNFFHGAKAPQEHKPWPRNVVRRAHPERPDRPAQLRKLPEEQGGDEVDSIIRILNKVEANQNCSAR